MKKLLSLILALAMLAMPLGAFAASVEPQFNKGNDANKKQYTAPAGMVRTTLEKCEKAGTYTYTFNNDGEIDENGENILTVTVVNGEDFTYVSNWEWDGEIALYAMIVKGGNGFNLYQYDGIFSDTDLVSPTNASGHSADISHVSVILDPTTPVLAPTPAPTAEPAPVPTEEPTPAPTEEPHEGEVLSFDNVRYAYIFGYEPVIETITNPDGTTGKSVSIEMAMDDSVTIEQVCAMLSRAIDQEYDNTPDSYPASANTSAHADAWYYRGISYLDSLGAFDNGEAVVGPATRGQVAQIIALGLNLENADSTTSFTDIADNKFKAYIEAVAEYGYMQGISAEEFAPDEIMTRAEFCALFNNILGKADYGLTTPEGVKVTAETYYFVDMSPSHWAYDICLIATSAYFEDGTVDMDTRLANIRNKLDQYDAQKEY